MSKLFMLLQESVHKQPDVLISVPLITVISKTLFILPRVISKATFAFKGWAQTHFAKL